MGMGNNMNTSGGTIMGSAITAIKNQSKRNKAVAAALAAMLALAVAAVGLAPAFAAEGDIASGMTTFTNNGSKTASNIPWRIDADGVLILGKAGETHELRTAFSSGASGENKWPWQTDDLLKQITAIRFEGTVKAYEAINHMFCDAGLDRSTRTYRTLDYVDFTNFDTSDVWQIRALCRSVHANVLNLGSNDLSRIGNMASASSGWNGDVLNAFDGAVFSKMILPSYTVASDNKNKPGSANFFSGTGISGKNTENWIKIADGDNNPIAYGAGSVTKYTTTQVAGRLGDNLKGTWMVESKVTQVDIIKQDPDGYELRGAKLHFAGGSENIDYTYTTKRDGLVTYNLPAGEYTLEELTAPDGYVLNTGKVKFTVKDDGTVVDADGKVIADKKVIMKNYPYGDVTVTKVWDDDSNADNKRPTEDVVLVLDSGLKDENEEEITYSTGENYTDAKGDTQTAGNWETDSTNSNKKTYTFKNLPLYNPETGEKLNYTVDEPDKNVPDGYVKSVDGLTVTNTAIDKKQNITVTKIWNDRPTDDRPEEIILRLTGGDIERSSADKIENWDKTTNPNEWTYTFKDLDVYDEKGNTINYELSEDPVSGYTPVINGFRIANNSQSVDAITPKPPTQPGEKVTYTQQSTPDNNENTENTANITNKMFDYVVDNYDTSNHEYYIPTKDAVWTDKEKENADIIMSYKEDIRDIYFFGSLCSAHDLTADDIIAQIEGAAKQGEVHYFLEGIDYLPAAEVNVGGTTYTAAYKSNNSEIETSKDKSHHVYGTVDRYGSVDDEDKEEIEGHLESAVMGQHATIRQFAIDIVRELGSLRPEQKPAQVILSFDYWAWAACAASLEGDMNDDIDLMRQAASTLQEYYEEGKVVWLMSNDSKSGTNGARGNDNDGYKAKISTDFDSVTNLLSGATRAHSTYYLYPDSAQDFIEDPEAIPMELLWPSFTNAGAFNNYIVQAYTSPFNKKYTTSYEWADGTLRTWLDGNNTPVSQSNWRTFRTNPDVIKYYTLSKRMAFYQFALLNPDMFLEVTAGNVEDWNIPHIDDWMLATYNGQEWRDYVPTYVYESKQAAQFLSDNNKQYNRYTITDTLNDGLLIDTSKDEPIEFWYYTGMDESALQGIDSESEEYSKKKDAIKAEYAKTENWKQLSSKGDDPDFFCEIDKNDYKSFKVWTTDTDAARASLAKRIKLVVHTELKETKNDGYLPLYVEDFPAKQSPRDTNNDAKGILTFETTHVNADDPENPVPIGKATVDSPQLRKSFPRTIVSVTKEWKNAKGKDADAQDDVILHIRKKGDSTDILPAQKITKTGEQTVTWGDLKAYEGIDADGSTVTQTALKNFLHRYVDDKVDVDKEIEYEIVEEYVTPDNGAHFITTTSLVSHGVEQKANDIREAETEDYTIVNEEKPKVKITKVWENDDESMRPDELTTKLLVKKYKTYDNAVTISTNVETGNDNYDGTFTIKNTYKENKEIKTWTLKNPKGTSKASGSNLATGESATAQVQNDTTPEQTYGFEFAGCTLEVEFADGNKLSYVLQKGINTEVNVPMVLKTTEDEPEEIALTPPEAEEGQTVASWDKTGANKWVYEKELDFAASTFESLHAFEIEPSTYNYKEKNSYISKESPVKFEYQESDPDKGYYTATLTNEYQTGSIEVTKIWQDGNNQDGTRPSKLTFTLSGRYTVTTPGAPGEEATTEEKTFRIPTSIIATREITVKTGTEKVSDGNEEGTVKWEGLPLTAEGQPITYTVTEDATGLTAYTTKVKVGDGTEAEGRSASTTLASDETKTITVTNSYTPKTVKITANKDWQDSEDQDGKRSQNNAKVKLEWTTTPNNDSSWKGITELVASAAADVEVPEWFGEGANKTSAGKITEWDNLPAYKDGALITYRVVETDLDDEYGIEKYNDGTAEGLDKNKFAYSGTGAKAEGTITVTNQYPVETASISVEKIWQDENNRDGSRPEKLIFTLTGEYTKEGETTPTTFTITNDAQEYTGFATTQDNSAVSVATWTGLPVYQEGAKVKYTVTESAPEGADATKLNKYNTTYTGTDTAKDNEGFELDKGSDYKVTVTNKYTPEKVYVRVTKEWAQDSQFSQNPANGIGSNNEYAHQNVIFNITATAGTDSVAVPQASKEVKTTDTNQYAEWTGLYKYANQGTLITYSVSETPIDGWTASGGTLVAVDADGETTNNEADIAGYTTSITNTPVESRDKLNEVKLNVLKKDALGGGGLSGAKFTVYQADGETLATAEEVASSTVETAGPEGTVGTASITFKKDGTYIIKETQAPTGYVLSDATYTIMVDKDLKSITLEDDNTANPATKFWQWLYDLLINKEDSSVSEPDTLTEENGVYTLTVKNQPKKANLTATKTWADNNNQDGKRVATTLKLQKKVGNGTWADVADKSGDVLITYENPRSTVTTFTDLPAYENGQVVMYRVVEESAEGLNVYTITYDTGEGTEYKSAGDGVDLLDATDTTGNTTEGKSIDTKNSYTPKTTSLTITKKWNDTDEDLFKADGDPVASYTRPTVTVTVKGVYTDDNNQEQTAYNEQTVTLTGETKNGTTEWTSDPLTGLPVFADSGKQVRYIVTEKVPEGYTVTGDNPITLTPTSNNNGATYTLNDAEFENTPVTKEAYNPLELTILKAEQGRTTGLSGAEFGLYTDSTCETAAEEGKATISGATGTDGKATVTFKEPGTYYIKETKAPTGYTASNDVYTVVVEKGGIVSVTKKTDSEATPSAWFEKLYDLIFGSASSALESDGKTLKVENAPEKATITVDKVWKDGNNQDGLRTGTIEFTLSGKAGETDVSITDATKNMTNETLLTADDNAVAGSITWEVPIYRDGVKVKYSVVETRPEGSNLAKYGTTYSATGIELVKNPEESQNKITVTNTYGSQTTSLKIVKTWNDAKYFAEPATTIGDDNKYARPTSLTFTITAKDSAGTPVTLPDGKATITLSDANKNGDYKWETTISDLPVFANGGKPITYTVNESVPAGYTSDPAATGTPATASRSITPALDQASNSYLCGDAEFKNTPVDKEEYNPAEITILKTDALSGYGLANGKFKITTKPTGSDMEDSYTTGNDGTVAVSFDVPGVYVIEEDTAPTGYVKSDTKFTFTVDKTLTKIEVKTDETAWTWFYDLIARLTGKTPDTATDSWNDTTKTLTVPNQPETATITVEKKWDDKKNQDGLRTGTIEFTLSGKAGETDVSITDATKNMTNETLLTADDNAVAGSITWEVPIYRDGEKITYSVVETKPDGSNLAKYETTYSDDSNGITLVENPEDGQNKITVTNKYTPETASVKVIKVWADGGDQDGKRPDTLSFTLSGKDKDNQDVAITGATKSDYPVTKNKPDGDDGFYEWTNLPVYKDGVKIKYSVTENTNLTTDGYSAPEYSATGVKLTKGETCEIRVTNSYTPETASVSVVKVWNDGSNQDGMRPDKLNFTLTGTYTPEGGTEKTFTVPNDGETKEYTVVKTVNSAEGVATWTGLPVYQEGAKVKYTVTESAPDGADTTKLGAYSISYSENAPFELTAGNTETAPKKVTFTNTYTPRKVSITVDKVWNDNSDASGERANNNGKVTLQYNAGTDEAPDWKDVDPVKEATVLTGFGTNNEEDSGQVASWTDLPAYNNGALIKYRVVETGTSPYYSATYKAGDAATNEFSYTGSEETSAAAITVTNTYLFNAEPPTDDKTTVKGRYDSDGNDQSQSWTPTDWLDKINGNNAYANDPVTGTNNISKFTLIVDGQEIEKDTPVTVDGVGTYTLTVVDGVPTVTFEPAEGFTNGTGTEVKIRAYDEVSTHTVKYPEATYKPVVVDNKRTATAVRKIEYTYLTRNGETAVETVEQTVELFQIANVVVDEEAGTGTTDYKDVPWKPVDEDEKEFSAVTSPVYDDNHPELSGWKPAMNASARTPNPAADKDAKYDETSKTFTYPTVHIIYTPTDNNPLSDTTIDGKYTSTGGMQEQKSKAFKDAFEDELNKALGTDKLPDGSDNAIIPGSFTMVNPDTGKEETEFTLKNIGTYKIDVNTGAVTFTPDPNIPEGAATTVTIKAKDKLSEEVAKATEDLKEEIEKLTGEIETLEEEIANLDSNIAAANDNIETLTKDLAGKQKALEDAKTDLAAAEQALEALKQELDAMEPSDPDYQAKQDGVNAKQADVDAKKADVSDKQTAVDDAQTQLADAEADCDKLIADKNAKETDLDIKKAEKEDAEKRVEDYPKYKLPTATYTPNVVLNSETATPTRTITYTYITVDGDQVKENVVQTLEFTRYGTYNPETGEVEYDSSTWIAKDGKDTFDAVNSPIMEATGGTGWHTDTEVVPALRVTDPTKPIEDEHVVYTPTGGTAVEDYWVTYIDPATGRVIQEKIYQPKTADEPPAPADPTRDGYTFDGWDREVDADGNITYKAKWVPVGTPEPPAPINWVRYIDSDGSTVYLPQTDWTLGTTEPAAPEDPTKEGYTFDGWDRTVDEDGNVTYIARWKPAITPEPEPEPDSQPSPSPTPTPNPSPQPSVRTTPVPTGTSASGVAVQATPKTADSAPYIPVAAMLVASAATMALSRRRLQAVRLAPAASVVTRASKHARR